MQKRLTLLPPLAALTVGLTGCSGCADGSRGSNSGPRDASTPPAPTGHGTVSLAWELSDLSDQPIQCAQVGARTVGLVLRAQGAATGEADAFTCSSSPSTSKAILPGIYDVSFELHADGVTLATAPDQSGVVIVDGRNTPLTPLTFAVDARGGLALSLATPPATTNCKAPSMMGAGINGVTITLMTAAGGCAPMTFVHTRGAMTLQPYTVNCSSPQVSACIESDETLTVPDMASGPYTLHVRGKIGAIECWKSDDSLQIPALGMALTQKVNLALLSEISQCLP
jgi:hypothetical protein